MADSKNAPIKIKQAFTISVSPDQAFDVFTKKLNMWWPKEYTWSAGSLDVIKIEPKKGGRCFERGPHGFECDWGRVLEWQPPHLLVFTWQINPDRSPEPNPEKASEIQVTFEEINSKTKVSFIHKNLEKHGNNAVKYKEALASPNGWPYILDNFQKAVT